MNSLTLLLSLFTVLTTALPTGITTTRDVEIARDLELDGGDVEERTVNLFRNDLDHGSSSDCPDAIFIYARGSTEPGNMGITVGPVLTRKLESEFKDSIWIQGVSSPYNALISPNLLPKGTNQASINEAKRLFRLAHSKCPSTPVVTAGYSQGSAVVGNALTELDETVKDQVVGAALFGYTKNLQNSGTIVDFPRERTEIFCEPGDAVCWGTLFVLPGHLLYLDEAADEAPKFLAGRVRDASASSAYIETPLTT